MVNAIWSTVMHEKGKEHKPTMESNRLSWIIGLVVSGVEQVDLRSLAV